MKPTKPTASVIEEQAYATMTAAVKGYIALMVPDQDKANQVYDEVMEHLIGLTG